MPYKILVIALGGTIGSVKKDSISLDDNALKILDFCKYDDVIFEGVCPFTCMSENMTRKLWQNLIDVLDKIDYSKYKGVIILHGSDTLAYTSSIIANAFYDKNIVLTASDKPIEDCNSNGINNFNKAVEHIINSTVGVYVSYDGIMRGDCITSADINDKFRYINTNLIPTGKKKISHKHILIIKPYVSMDTDCINLEKVDAVIFEMFHSATVPQNIIDFSKKLKCPYCFVTHKDSAEYETAKGIENIIFNCTTENAYARMILE